MHDGFQPQRPANVRRQGIEGIGLGTGEMALATGALHEHLDGLTLMLPDGAAGTMVDIQFTGPVIEEFGPVERLLVTDAVKKGRIELTGR
tara:strand:+ start:3069 stop:3338 length:270 start_codon:yes stop_codon:yes gene_type:complete